MGTFAYHFCFLSRSNPSPSSSCKVAAVPILHAWQWCACTADAVPCPGLTRASRSAGWLPCTLVPLQGLMLPCDAG